MALKLRKDIKKSSYYVWFLGAKESKGLRGIEFILPVIKHLEEREKDIEPFKVTLQISHKGIKIIQNLLGQNINGGKTKTKNETIKHFIPHNTITYVHQQNDVIACVLLLFNPVTKCPLHIHAYRCDSLETATLLKHQLQILVERPDNQKKIGEIEKRLQTYKCDSSVIINNKIVDTPIDGCDDNNTTTTATTTTTTTTSSSTREESSESSEERNYQNDLRLTTLYDSVAAELREKLNRNKVPILLPPRDYDTVHRQKGNLTGIELRRCLNDKIVGQNVKCGKINNKNHNNRRIESSGGSSGIGSDHPPSPDSPDAVDSRRFHSTMDNQSTTDDEDWSGDAADSTLYLVPPNLTLPRPNSGVQRERTSPERVGGRFPDRHHRGVDWQKSLEKKRITTTNNNNSISHQNNINNIDERYFDDRRHQNSERYVDLEKRYLGKDGNDGSGGRRLAKEKPVKYFDDDGFDENLRYRNRSNEFPNRHILDNVDDDDDDDEEEDDDVFEEKRRPYSNNEIPVPKVRQRFAAENRFYCPSPQGRQRSPPSSNETSPRERFKDAKEKFLSMEKESSHERVTLVRRNESLACDRDYFESRPRPAPRQQMPAAKDDPRAILRHRPSGDKYDPKRRSMFNLIEEEHRKNSSEIAKELKRRSYMENGSYDDLPESDHYRSRADADYRRHQQQPFAKPSADLDKVGADRYLKNQKVAGFRHSYAEPKMKMDKRKHYPEMLQRANSVSNNNGRVGIASVHPY